MAAVHEQYTEEMRREFGYLAAWLPGSNLRLGDVGFLHRDRFDHVTTLQDLGVRATSRTGGTREDLEYASAGQVEIDWGNRAAGVAGAAAVRTAVTLRFRRAHATFFQAAGCTIHALDDLVTLEKALVELAGKGVWRRGLAVVTEVVRARSAAVFVSSQAGARVDLNLGGDAALAPVTLAHAASRLHVRSVSGMAVRILSATGMTPLFRVSALRGGTVRAPRLTYRGDTEPAPNGTGGFGRLEPLSYETAEPAGSVPGGE